MPRRKGIPAYQLHRASGQARVRIDGKDPFLGRHGTADSKAKYETVVRALIERRAKDEFSARIEVSSSLTIAELCASYLAFARTYYVKNGVPTAEFGNIVSSVRVMLDRLSHELVTAFGPVKLMAIRDAWAAEGVVRNQINHRVRRVRRMFKWGVSRELISVEALERLKTIEGLTYGRTSAVEGRKVHAVPDTVVDAVCPVVSRQVWAMIELQRLTGMRTGEVTIMRTIDVGTSGPLWMYTPSRHKTEHRGKDRRIVLGPRAIEFLKPSLRLNVGEYLFQPREARAESFNCQRLRTMLLRHRSGGDPVSYVMLVGMKLGSTTLLRTSFLSGLNQLPGIWIRCNLVDGASSQL